MGLSFRVNFHTSSKKMMENGGQDPNRGRRPGPREDREYLDAQRAREQENLRRLEEETRRRLNELLEEQAREQYSDDEDNSDDEREQERARSGLRKSTERA